MVLDICAYRNNKYQLADNYIVVLEADQFNETMSRNKIRAAIFTENLKECSPGMVCRTMIGSHRGSDEYAYCFPTPEMRKRRCTEIANNWFLPCSGTEM